MLSLRFLFFSFEIDTVGGGIDLFKFLIDYLDAWRVQHPILRFWAGPFPVFMIYTPDAAEVIQLTLIPFRNSFSS